MATEKLAIDFDSAYTNIYKLGSGMVLSEPTVAAISDDEGAEVKAIGTEARKLIGKTAKNTKTLFPVFEGEIVNEKVAAGLLNGFLKKIDVRNGFFGCQTLFALPCGYTQEMLDKVYKVARSCGISKVYYAESPILSALGQRIPLNDSTPYFIIDMAGGVTNIAAVTLDGIIAGISVNFGANKISTDIIDYVLENYGLQIGLLTAERLKREVGSLEEGDELSTVVNGRDVKTGTPRAVLLKAKDILEPIKKYYDKIAEISLNVLKKLPPEVSAEIRHSGIYVAGGASSVYGLERYYEEIFAMPVNVAKDGLFSVALGAGVVMGDDDLLKKIAACYK